MSNNIEVGNTVTCRNYGRFEYDYVYDKNKNPGFFDYAGSKREIKVCDTEATTDDTVYNCVDIDQGTTASDRIGNQILVIAVEVINTGSVPASARPSVLIVDKQTNGAGPLTSEVLATNTLFRNWTWLRRFDILCPVVDYMTAAIPFSNNANRPFWVNCRVPVRYTAATGDVANISETGLFFMTGDVTSSANIRVYFIDM